MREPEVEEWVEISNINIGYDEMGMDLNVS